MIEQISITNIFSFSIFAYAFLLLLYFIYGFVIIYHLIRFGVGIQPKIVAFVFFVGSLILVLPTIVFYLNVDGAAAFTAFINNVQIGIPQLPN